MAATRKRQLTALGIALWGAGLFVSLSARHSLTRNFAGLILVGAGWSITTPAAERRRRLEQGGLRPEPAFPGFGQGALLGVPIFTAVIAILAARHWYHFADIGPRDAGEFATLLALAVALVPAAALEEAISRGFVYRRVEGRWGGPAALLVSSVIFAVPHAFNPNRSVTAIASLLMAGVMFGGLYAATRSVWLTTGVHWMWNLLEGPGFGTRVSGFTTPSVVHPHLAGPVAWTGGKFGPEAGWAVVIVTGVVAAISLAVALSRARFPVRGAVIT